MYVLDGAADGAGDVSEASPAPRPEQPFGPGVKAGLSDELADRPPVEFVARRSDAIEGAKARVSPGHVIGEGVLLTLGPIAGGGRRVEVGGNLWISGLAGLRITYVVERRNDRWKVTGTTGPMAIS